MDFPVRRMKSQYEPGDRVRFLSADTPGHIPVTATVVSSPEAAQAKVRIDRAGVPENSNVEGGVRTVRREALDYLPPAGAHPSFSYLSKDLFEPGDRVRFAAAGTLGHVPVMGTVLASPEAAQATVRIDERGAPENSSVAGSTRTVTRDALEFVSGDPSGVYSVEVYE